MICPIEMKTKEDVERVSREAANLGIDMSVSCGNVMIDPRSILALFTLMGKRANLVAPDHLNPKVFERLVKRMGVAV